MMIRLSVSSSGAPFSFTAHGKMTPTRRERAALIGVVCSRSSFANETTVKMRHDLASRKWLDTQLTNQSAAQRAACSHQTLGVLQTEWLQSNRFRRRLRLKMVENPKKQDCRLILFCAKVPNQVHFLSLSCFYPLICLYPIRTVLHNFLDIVDLEETEYLALCLQSHAKTDGLLCLQCD